jgi:hypothetical protein
MSDDPLGPICDRLRSAPANLIGTEGEDCYWACQDAAAEIERLRSEVERLRLTPEERWSLLGLFNTIMFEPDKRAIQSILSRQGGGE